MNKAEYETVFRSQVRERGFSETLISPYYDLVTQIAELAASKTSEKMITLGMAGAQGSGKSTLALLVNNVLEDVFELRAATLSIDDFYLTRMERKQLSDNVHPMLAVRGVPGTHDMKLLGSVIDALAAGESVATPMFSKGEDDRLSQTRPVAPPDVLLLEGWCWGARPCENKKLSDPVNRLEAEQDADLVWRRYVNDALASNDYQRCFDNDLNVFLAVPDMKAVYRWRLQQEQESATGRRVMDAEQVREFIMYYERISARMLQEPRADVVVRLQPDHSVGAVEDGGGVSAE